MTRSFASLRLLALLTFLFVCAGAFAQSTVDGAIGGTVYDAQKAAVPNAMVTVHNNGTNADQKTTTDAGGNYRAVKLRPGIYTVTIEANGFKKTVQENVIVEVGRITNVEPELTVGGSQETVSVTSEAPTVNTEEPDFASNVNQTAINNLPINGRRWSNFALLTPGVVNDASGFGLLSFRGISSIMNNNTVDGADNNQAFFSEERGRTRAQYSTSQVAVEEFQVNTSNYSAEYGRAAGGVVNTVTKSGTNSLHGQAFFLDRDNSWGAINPFSKLAVNQNGTFVQQPFKPTDWRKQWGFGVGGPIIKDKLFFFYAYDQNKRNFPGVARANDPNNFFAAPATDAATSCSASTLSTATQGACALQKSLGLTTYAAGAAKYNEGLGILNSMLGTVPRTGDQMINFPKLDWVVNDKNRVSLQYNRLRWDSPAGIQTQRTNTLGRASFGDDFVKEDWGIARLNTTISNTMTNELRYQYGRDFEFENTQSPTAAEVPLANNQFGRPPSIAIATATGFTIGTPNFLERGKFPDERRNQVTDTVSSVRGKHVLKYGADYNHAYDAISNLFNEHGSYSYTTTSAFLADYFHAVQGLGPATLGKGYSTFSQQIGPRSYDFATKDYAFFVSDDWKFTPRLTVTLGARYEYEALPQPFAPNSALPQTFNRPSDHNNIGPRVGFAWDIFGSGKTVLRGGYGLYYGRMVNSTLFSTYATSGANPGAQLPLSLVSTTGPVFPNIVSSVGTKPIPGVLFFDKAFQNPQVHQFDVVAEHELGKTMVVSASYLGSFGRELPNFIDTNLNPSTISSLAYTVRVLGQSGVGAMASPLADGAVFTTPLFTAKRPNASFQQITDVVSNINSSYNALVLQANRRMSHGVQFMANYTWAHSLDFNQNQSTTVSPTNTVLDPTNQSLEYGNSNFDVRHRVVVNAIFQPTYKFNGVLGRILNDFTFSPVFAAQSGLPQTITVSGSAPGAGISGINGSGGTSRIAILGRNSINLPRTADMDMRISKRIAVGERYSFELLGEAFNLFNHQNVTGINTTGYQICSNVTAQGCAGSGATTTAPALVYQTNFGAANNANSNVAYTERQIQLGLRFMF